MYSTLFHAGAQFRALRDSLWYFTMLVQSDSTIGRDLSDEDTVETPVPHLESPRGRDAAAKARTMLYSKLGIMHSKFLEAYSSDSRVGDWPALAATAVVIPKSVLAGVVAPGGLHVGRAAGPVVDQAVGAVAVADRVVHPVVHRVVHRVVHLEGPLAPSSFPPPCDAWAIDYSR